MAVCIVCGKEFEPKNKYNPAKTCCTKCRGEHQKILNRWKRKMKEEKEAAEDKPLPTEIKEIVKLAKAKGVTYGQLVAEHDKKMVRVRRKHED